MLVYVSLAKFNFKASFFVCNVPVLVVFDGPPWPWSNRQPVPDSGNEVLCRYSWELSSDNYIVQEEQPLLFSAFLEITFRQPGRDTSWLRRRAFPRDKACSSAL